MILETSAFMREGGGMSYKFVNKSVGLVQSEFTPMDLTALLDDLAINQIATSKVEIGIQQKLYL
uniref:hypothetical protein n=1 Tax=Campylobacter hyointestinalis TaxID=198 RepID=UPI00358E4BB7